MNLLKKLVGGQVQSEKRTNKTAVRILIAHSGDHLASGDANEILKYAWDGQLSPGVKITSHPLTPDAWAGTQQPDRQFATAWVMWQQMLQHKYGEHPYWEDHKTH